MWVVHIKDTKTIIEFDGIYWHDYNRRNKPELANKEDEKDLILGLEGYRVLRINESEWDENKKGTIKKCLKFINDK